MPRTYKPDPTKKCYKKYDPNIISAALKDLEQPHASRMEIASKYNIHKSVLYRHSQKIMKPQGGQTALSEEAELIIIENINVCAEWGYPMDKMDLRLLVKMYLDKLGVVNRRFKNNFPGIDFVQSFLKRHKDKISQRICENIKRARAAVSPDLIQGYFNELEKSLQGVELQNIINYDETNLSDEPGRKKVLMKRGCKYPERVVNHSKSSVSVMIAGTADGEMLPPYVVYKAQHLYDTWVLNGPKGTHYNRSTSGWFEGVIFEDWVEKIVIPYFKDKPGRKILIGDNLSSHLSVSLIKSCKEQNIDFVFLPPNSTHLTQPLDVAFFRPMKRAWREILLKWKKTDGQKQASVPKGCFPKLLKLLIEHLKENAKNNLQAGFKKTGISPLNIEEILSRLPQEQNSDDIKNAINDSVLEMLKQMRYGTINAAEPKKKRKLEVIAGKSVTAEETGNNLEANNETVEAKKSKSSKNKGKGKGKTTKAQTLQEKKNLNIEPAQEDKGLQNKDEANNIIQAVTQKVEKIEDINGLTLDEKTDTSMPFIKELQKEHKANKNNQGPLEIENVEPVDGLKLDKLDVNSMPFLFLGSECEVISESHEFATKEEKSCDIVTEANSTTNLIEHENNLHEIERKIETRNSIDIQKIVKSELSEKYTEQQKKIALQNDFLTRQNNKMTEDENKTKREKRRTNIPKRKNTESIAKDEKYSAGSGSSSKTDIGLKKMNKVKIISNKKGKLTQYVDLKGCKPIKIQDVMIVPSTSGTKKTETKKNINYYNKGEEIFKVLTDSDSD